MTLTPWVADDQVTATRLQAMQDAIQATLDQIAVIGFGDGSDGDVTIASGTTTLTRHMFYDTLTVDAGARLDANGWAIYARTEIVNNGAISVNGAVGGNAAGQTGGVAATYTNSGPFQQAGQAGKNSSTGGGTQGFAGVGAKYHANDFPASGAGGDCSSPGGNSGYGGVAGALGDSVVAYPQPRTAQMLAAEGYFAVTTHTLWVVGVGQSPGGSSGSTYYSSAAYGGAGGAAGGTGGILPIFTPKLSGNGTLESKGGAGGNGSNGASGSGQYGGGGGGGTGGGGGLVVGCVADRASWAGSVVVTGGAKGNKGLKGGGAAVDGGDGGVGPAGTSWWIPA
jgi:hypothetical protein